LGPLRNETCKKLLKEQFMDDGDRITMEGDLLPCNYDCIFFKSKIVIKLLKLSQNGGEDIHLPGEMYSSRTLASRNKLPAKLMDIDILLSEETFIYNANR